MRNMSKGPALLRLNNQKRVMTQLRRLRVTSRQDLARILSLSKNTVSLIVDELLEQALVQELGPVSVAAAGRPKIEIALLPDRLKSAGVMVERNVIYWRVCDYFSQVIVEQTRRTDTSNPRVLLEEVANLCHELAEKHPQLLGIGLGFPGIVDPQRGWMHLSTHLGWQDVDLLTPVRQKVNLPLRVMNNVKASALLAVQQLGLDTGSSHFYVRISEGMGGALVQQGEVVTGNSWTAGEAGHLVVQPDGPRCRCGRQGCIEALISKPAIEQQLAQRRPGLSWQTRNEAPKVVDEVMQLAGGFLAKALGPIVLLLNPASVIVDAPWNVHSLFCDTVRKRIESSTPAFTFQHTALHFLQTRLDPAVGLSLAVIEQFEQRQD
ncbi:ROK family protein [Candidatus Pantoea deserta]|uniref:ROK family protein n=1 Tax=Candidatus Pantoea deserta TaxID=1869313 RepID=A0A3N4NZB5_9GAMM|nr:ROK family protein [Pantoea deserta]RPD97600.1 ROK family protein [Pantoea deserta]